MISLVCKFKFYLFIWLEYNVVGHVMALSCFSIICRFFSFASLSITLSMPTPPLDGSLCSLQIVTKVVLGELPLLTSVNISPS